MAKIKLSCGDVTRVPSQCLITSISPQGPWVSGIDHAIRKVAGRGYHDAAAAKFPLRDGQTVLARGGPRHSGEFRDVLFVVDGLKRPLSGLVLTALEAADNNGIAEVTLPVLRMGVAVGKVERTAAETVKRLCEGVQQFVANNPRSIRQVEIVAFSSDVQRKLRSALI